MDESKLEYLHGYLAQKRPELWMYIRDLHDDDFQCLDDRERTVCTLKDMQGLKHTEIAQKLKIMTAAVRQIYSRAHRRLAFDPLRIRRKFERQATKGRPLGTVILRKRLSAYKATELQAKYGKVSRFV